MKYIALLRGINVGGNSLIKMSELKKCFENIGLDDVRTYINSGNVIFTSSMTNKLKLANKIESEIEKTFLFPVRVVVIDEKSYRKIIKSVPKGWKYNLLFMSFGKTTSGKLASKLSYKKMTIRNWNTSKKLLEIMKN